MRYFLFNIILFSGLLLINLMASHGLSSILISHIEDHPMIKYVWQIGVYLFFYFYFKLLYSRMASANASYLMIKANFLALFTILAIIFLLKESESYSRIYVSVFFVLNSIMPILVYMIKKYMMRFSWLRDSIIVVCDESGYQNISKWFDRDNIFGYDVKKYIFLTDDMGEDKKILAETLKKYGIHTAVVAIDKFSIEKTFTYMEYLQHYLNRVIVLPKMTAIPLVNAEIITLINHRGLAFSTRNNLLNPIDKFFKMIFDFSMTTISVIVLSPLLLLLYLAVFVSTQGKPIFKHKRIGKNGKPFDVYKFRTMQLNSQEILDQILQSDEKIRQEWEKEHKLKNDPRITKIGHFLRKTSLDELPQLINVMKGEMSLVGPRPITNEEIVKYGEYFHYYKAVKPGITGLWQISGRNDVSYDERVLLDTWYVKNWSIEQDLIILIKTITIVLSRKGSY